MKRNLILTAIAGVFLICASGAGAITYKGDLQTEESVAFPEQPGVPVSPPSGQRKLYFKSDGNLYHLDSNGNENPIASRGFKNVLINGNFDIWQRGTSFSSGLYTADRWEMAIGDGAQTVSRQSFTPGQTAVPGEPRYYLDFNKTSAGTITAAIQQKIEGVRTFAGQTVTVSFWAKASSASTPLNGVFLIQNFGTGGSPSASVQINIGNPSLTTAWQKFTYTATLGSLSGKTLGTNGDDYLMLHFSVKAIVTNFDIAQVQVEAGSVATAFERRPLALEMYLAKRYYQRVNMGRVKGFGTSATDVVWHITLDTPMRAAPAVTTLNQPAAHNPGNSVNVPGGGSTIGGVQSPFAVQVRQNGYSVTPGQPYVGADDASGTINLDAFALDAEL